MVQRERVLSFLLSSIDHLMVSLDIRNLLAKLEPSSPVSGKEPKPNP